MPLAVLALALSMFAIGTTEFVVVGLVPDLAADLDVGVPTVGLLITGYALGIALAGPILAAATGRVERKRLLLALMGLFIAGNAAAGLAPDFALLLAARILTSFSHALFVSVAIALAISLVPRGRQASAIAAIFAGLTVALAVGVPLGTFVGENLGWRVPFFVVALFGTVAFVADAVLLPRAAAEELTPIRARLQMLTKPRLLAALVVATLGFGGQILAYSYISPFLETITKTPPSELSLLLLVFGVAAAIGTFAAGPLGDRWPVGSVAAGLVLLALVLLAMTFVAGNGVAAIVGLVLWGALGFGLAPLIQNLVNLSSPGVITITGSLAVSAFNLGIAGGSVFGGLVVARLGVGSVTWVGAATVSAAAIVAVALAFHIRPSFSASFVGAAIRDTASTAVES